MKKGGSKETWEFLRVVALLFAFADDFTLKKKNQINSP
jgi:hypothetical protein